MQVATDDSTLDSSERLQITLGAALNPTGCPSRLARDFPICQLRYFPVTASIESARNQAFSRKHFLSRCNDWT